MMGQHQEKLILTRNEVYHRTDSIGNQLPFLDTLEVSFINSQKKELEMFQQKEIEMVVGLPAESVRDVVEQKIAYFEQDPPIFILERVADMSTYFYVFNLNKEIFSGDLEGKKVRQAISYAINREKIIDKMLSGEAEGPGVHGVTPSSLIGYDISKIAGYGYDPVKAKELLSDAGYADGKNFPTLVLKINDDAKNTRVAIEVQKQLKTVLNINLELAILPMHELVKAQQMADGDIFRSGWIADYPSPENFLHLFHGKSVPEDLSTPSLQNVSRYVNPAFDELYEKGLNADSTDEKYALYAEAEQLMIADAPIVVMWYDEQYRLIQSNIHDMMINPMLYRDFSEVYMQEPKPKPRKTAAPIEKESEEEEASTEE
jgi:peptide/nickel transport system substrate-binding protein